MCYEPRNLIQDWPEETDEQIELSYACPSKLIKEVPMSLQLSNKKRKQLLKQQRLIQQQLMKQQQLLEEEERKVQEEEDRRARLI